MYVRLPWSQAKFLLLSREFTVLTLSRSLPSKDGLDNRREYTRWLSLFAINELQELTMRKVVYVLKQTKGVTLYVSLQNECMSLDHWH